MGNWAVIGGVTPQSALTYDGSLARLDYLFTDYDSSESSGTVTWLRRPGSLGVAALYSVGSYDDRFVFFSPFVMSISGQTLDLFLYGPKRRVLVELLLSDGGAPGAVAHTHIFTTGSWTTSFSFTTGDPVQFLRVQVL
ncbi:hypothetical protein AYO49_06510 [Verrucomicrobiaceae bacterium SCGC AG-212-N21]|nr:hypothetical protein AYO49_06510 [Verrucomicrobiaceae bacterium SCGC AG-212-N21]